MNTTTTNTTNTSSITVDAALFEQFIAWMQAKENATPTIDPVEQPDNPDPDTQTDEPDESHVSTFGEQDSHGFIPSTHTLPALEGGRHGTKDEPQPEADAHPTDTDDEQQQPPYTSPLAGMTGRVRARRVNPATAQAYVLTAMKSKPQGTSFTIRQPRYAHSSYGLADAEDTSGKTGVVQDVHGITLTVAQIRSALTKMSERGEVYPHGKNGKQDRWYVHADQFSN